MSLTVKSIHALTGETRVFSDTEEDEAALRARLEASGEAVIWVRRRFRLRALQGARQLDIALIALELSRLLRAGLSLPEALQTQADRVQGSAQGLYREINERLQEGKRLSDALEMNGQFPLILVASVRAAERSGRVADALEEFARYEESIRQLRRKLINAAIYPVLVVGFGFLVSLFLLGYVVPRFSLIFSERVQHGGDTASQATTALISLGLAINSNPWKVLAIASLALAGTIFVVMRPEVRARLVALGCEWPPVARWLRSLQLARICHAMGMLLTNGFPVPEAMRLSSALAMRPDVARSMREGTLAIEQGQGISSAWNDSGLASSYMRRILQAGERTGNLATCFETLGTTLREEVETTLERTSRIAEPVLLIVVAAIIGVIVVLMYMPIFDLATAVGSQ